MMECSLVIQSLKTYYDYLIMRYLAFLRIAIHDLDHIIKIWPDTKKPKKKEIIITVIFLLSLL